MDGPDVLIVGSCNMDLISYTDRLPKPGETIHGHKFSTGYGGKGANQCVMAAKLGAKTVMVAKVGDDSFGRDTMQNFKDNKVNTEFIKVTSEAATGVAPITVNKEGQNSVVIVSGANLLLTPEDVKESFEKLKHTKVTVCQLEIRPETTLAALKLAKKHGSITILNPAPAIASLDEEFFQVCDIFCPNESEAELLLGESVTSVAEAKAACLTFLKKGCQKVIITMGGQGVVFATAADENPIHVPTKPVTPVDTTGAGDAFVGSLAYFLACLPSLSFQDMLQRACSIASISVCNPGTQKSFPFGADLPEDLLR